MLRSAHCPPEKVAIINTKWLTGNLLICFLPRWILVQLLHGFQPEWGLLPQRRTHQEHGRHHLVRMARIHLLTQEGGDEDPARGFQTIEGISIWLRSYTTSPRKRWAMSSQMIFHFIQHMQQPCTGDVHKHCDTSHSHQYYQGSGLFPPLQALSKGKKYCVRVG